MQCTVYHMALALALLSFPGQHAFKMLWKRHRRNIIDLFFFYIILSDFIIHFDFSFIYDIMAHKFTGNYNNNQITQKKRFCYGSSCDLLWCGHFWLRIGLEGKRVSSYWECRKNENLDWCRINLVVGVDLMGCICAASLNYFVNWEEIDWRQAYCVKADSFSFRPSVGTGPSVHAKWWSPIH